MSSVKIKRGLNVLIASIFLTPLAAQPLDTLIAIAFATNQELQALTWEYEAATHVADQVSDFPDPMVNTGIGLMPVQTRLGAQNLRLGISQNIPWKGLLKARAQLADAQALTKSRTIDVKKIDIEFQIRLAYNTLHFLQENIKIIDRRTEVLEVLMELAKSKVRAGKSNLSNVLQLETRIVSIRNDKMLLKKKMESPTIQINRWVNRPFNTPIITEENYFKKNLDVNLSTEDHPQIDILNQQIEVTAKAVDLVRLEEKPRLTLGLEYGVISARNDVDIINNGRDVVMPMAALTIPLNADRLHAKEREATLIQKSLVARQDEWKQQFNSEIQAAYSTIEYQNMVIEKNNELRGLIESTLTQMKGEFAADKKDFDDLLNLELQLIEYEKESLKAHYEKSMAYAILKKYNYE